MKRKRQERERKEREEKEHLARAKAQNLSISTKHCIEICRYLRYKKTAAAKKILEEVIALRRAVPFRRFNKDVGHKAGLAAGRFPQKAAREVLRLIKAAEVNAQFKGLDTAALKITKLLANRAPVPFTGGRQRTGSKRTHLEIEVREQRGKAKEGGERKESRKKEEKGSRKEEGKTKEKKEEKINEKKEEKIKSQLPQVQEGEGAKK